MYNNQSGGRIQKQLRTHLVQNKWPQGTELRCDCSSMHTGHSKTRSPPDLRLDIAFSGDVLRAEVSFLSFMGGGCGATDIPQP